MENMEKKTILKEVSVLALGELIVALLTVGVYFLLSLAFRDAVIFDYTVITGALLGAAVPVVNFLILTYAISRAANRYIDALGGRELSEEEAEAFAMEHRAKINLAVARSYIVRTLLMIAALVLAFVTGVFNPIATAVPLLAYKLIMYVTQYIRARGGRK